MEKLKKVEEHRFGSPRWDALYLALVEICEEQERLSKEIADMRESMKMLIEAPKRKPGRPKKNA